MIKYVISLMFSVSVLQAQKSNSIAPQNTIEVGDVFEIGQPKVNSYKYINFPRANFIIKGGGVANFDSVKGEKVVITSLKEKKNGTTEVKIKRTDGGRFFGSLTTVTANLDKALASGELEMK